MLSLDFGKGGAYNRLVLPAKRGKKDEVFETIQYYFAALLFGRTFAQADSPAHTGQCVRTCAYAGGSWNRNFKDSSGEGGGWVSHRDYAGHVHSGGSRTAGIQRCPSACVCSRGRDYSCDHHTCHGGNGSGDTENDTKGEKET